MTFRRYAAFLAVFAAGFAACLVTRPASRLNPRWPASPPEIVYVSQPMPDGTRASHDLRVTRLGTSHESGNLPLAAWRLVFVTAGGTFFAECEHATTVIH